MSKIIIHIEDTIPESDAMEVVSEVVAEGKISRNGDSYCLGTRFQNYMVHAEISRKGTHVFRVIKN